MRQLLSVLVSISIFAGGCKTSDATTSSDRDASSTTATDSDPVLAKLNASVPKDQVALVQFEATSFSGDANGDGQTDRGEMVTTYKPKAWLASPNPDSFPNIFLAPTALKEDASFDERYRLPTSFEVETDCDGLCEAKDWRAVIAKQIKESFGDGSKTKEEALAHNGRIVWGTWEDSDHAKYGKVYAAWYADGARVFRKCEVDVHDAKYLPALDAFAEACKASQKF